MEVIITHIYTKKWHFIFIFSHSETLSFTVQSEKMSQVFLGIHRKIARAKTEQVTDKANEKLLWSNFVGINRRCQICLLFFILSLFYLTAPSYLTFICVSHPFILPKSRSKLFSLPTHFQVAWHWSAAVPTPWGIMCTKSDVLPT